jgi:predicted nucleotidyltransferase
MMKTATLDLEKVTPILTQVGKRHRAVVKLEIFGSVAAGRTSKTSDLDVLVTITREFPRDSRYVDLFVKLIDEMQSAFACKVDLVDRNALSNDRFGYNAVRNLKTAYERL